jgi:peptidoglycan hydrolase-like protein with peptidoglycan-binding domain
LDDRDIEQIAPGFSGSAVKDVQTRLQLLGYELGGEADESAYGELTTAAVRSFRAGAGLPADDVVDRDAWVALVDATFTLGNRLLYLRVPYFHGHDVTTLQTALAALGFPCSADGIFGGHTERAVREFQRNAGIDSDGIVGNSTFTAIERLRHAWEGKDPLRLELWPLGFARAEEVLESTVIYVFGGDDLGRRVAERFSNLAQATTTASKIVFVEGLAPGLAQAGGQAELPGGKAPGLVDGAGLILELTTVAADDLSAGDIDGQGQPGAGPDSKILASGSDTVAVPQVVYDSDATLFVRLATAVGLLNAEQQRVLVFLRCPPRDGQGYSARDEQHMAIALLDAICLVYKK